MEVDVKQLAAAAIGQLTQGNDGFSLHWATSSGAGNFGFMVATEQSVEKVVALGLVTESTVASYLTDTSELLQSNPNNYFGGWVDNGQLYLDISERVMDIRKAVRLGVVRRQLGIYSLATNSTLDIRQLIS
jgi:hypothetical protein